MDETQAADDDAADIERPHRRSWRDRLPVIGAVAAALIAGALLGWMTNVATRDAEPLVRSVIPTPTIASSSRVFSEKDLRTAYKLGYDEGFANGSAEAEANAPREPDPCLTNPRARDNKPGAPCYWWQSISQLPTLFPTR